MSTIKKLLVVGLAGVTIFTTAGVASAQLTQQQIQSILSLLQSFGADQNTINNVQAALTGQSTSGSTGSGSGTTSQPTTACNFTRNLTVGSRGEDVKCLQKYLNEAGFTIAQSGAGSPGNETTYFGPATRAALIKWQQANGVSPASGYFGPLSRAKYNQLASGTGTGTGTGQLPASAYLKVEAVSLPGATVLPSGSIYNKVLRLKFQAGNKDEKVTGLTVTRGGFVSNSNITGVSVWDDNNNRYGNIVSSLTSDGKAILSFPSSPFIVPAGQTRYLNVAINLASGATSGSVSFSVASVNDIKVSSDSSQVEGPFPLVGQTYSLVDGSTSLGGVTFNTVSVSGANSNTSAPNVEIGETKEVYKFKLTANNNEAVKLNKVVLYVEGTLIETTDVKDWKLYSPEGNVLASAENPVDRYVTFNLENPYLIDKNLSKTFTVKATVNDGSGRWFRVYIQNDYDMLLYGVNSNAGIALPTYGSGTASGNGYFIIKQGTLTVSKATSSPSGSVLAPGLSNVVLAEFNVKSVGEKVDIRKMSVYISKVSPAPTTTGSINVKDKESGEIYLSVSANSVFENSSDGQFNLSYYPELNSGQTRTFVVEASNIPQTATSGSYTVRIGKFYGKRYATNDFTDLYTGTVSGNSVSISQVDLTVNKNTSYGNQAIVRGASEAKIGSFVFTASNVDNIVVTGLNLKINATTTNPSLQNLKLKTGDEYLGSVIANPSVDNTTVMSFSFNKEITKGGSIVIDVLADINTNASTDDNVTVTLTSVSGYGKTTQVNIDKSLNVAGQTITVAQPKLNIAFKYDTDVNSRILLAGKTGYSVAKIEFKPVADDMTIERLTLDLVSADTSIWDATTTLPSNFAKFSLYLNNKEVSGNYSLDGNKVKFELSNAKIEKNKANYLVVRVDLNDENTIATSSVFALRFQTSTTEDDQLFSVKYSAGSMNSSSVTTTLTATTSNYFLVHGTALSYAKANYSGSKSSAQQIGAFTLTNLGNISLTVHSTTVRVSVTGATNTTSTTNFRLYESNDMTNPVAASSTATIIGNGSLDVLFNFNTPQEISSGSSRTYYVVADTSNIARADTNTQATVEVRLVGQTGYSSSVGNYEKYWNDGPIVYKYNVTVGTSVIPNGPYVASDSGDVQIGNNSY